MGWFDVPQSGSLERRAPTLFLAAGLLLIGYTALNGIYALTDMTQVVVKYVVGPAGFVLGFIGLLGLYPGLVDRSRTLARIGAVCVGLGAVGLAVIAGLEATSNPDILLLFVAVGMILGYLSFGVAILRASAGGRPIGLLLFMPAVVFTAMLSQPLVYAGLGILPETPMAWSNFGISSAQAIAYLLLGYTLRGRITQNARDVRFADATVN